MSVILLRSYTAPVTTAGCGQNQLVGAIAQHETIGKRYDYADVRPTTFDHTPRRYLCKCGQVRVAAAFHTRGKAGEASPANTAPGGDGTVVSAESVSGWLRRSDNLGTVFP